MTAESPMVLVVEDNVADASLLTELLEGIRPPVTSQLCQTGEKALAFLQALERPARGAGPRLVLMDLRLPGRSGLEVLLALRKSPATQCLPVVILSTSDAPRDVRSCYEAGANAYLVKGSDPDELGHHVTLAVRLFCHAARPAVAPTPLDEDLLALPKT